MYGGLIIMRQVLHQGVGWLSLNMHHSWVARLFAWSVACLEAIDTTYYLASYLSERLIIATLAGGIVVG